MSFTGKPDLTTMTDLENDVFWPAVSMKEFVEAYRVMSEYDDSVIRWGLALALMRINTLLLPVKANAINPAAGCTSDATQKSYTSLIAWAALHSEKVDGIENSVRMYKHAVYSAAKAYLLQQFNVMNRRPQAENIKKEAPETEDYWLAQAKEGMTWLCNALAPCLVDTLNFGLSGSSGGGSVYVALI